MTQPNPAIVLDLIEAFRRSKTMFAAVSLGVFDLLAEESAGAEALAHSLNADPGALERLLDGCVGLGLLTRTAGAYANTEVSNVYLRQKSGKTLAGYVMYSNDGLFPMWSHLEDAVRHGSHRWNQTFGPGEQLFSHFFRTDQAMGDFLRGMHGFGQLTSSVLVKAFDLGAFRRMVDVGGATGHLAIEASRAWPNLQCALFDLPRVIGFAREYVDTANAAVELLAGDFFSDSLPDADLFALGRILHDWSEEKIMILLRKIYAALPPGGGLLVCEKLLKDDKTGPVSGLMQSLNMLVCTEGRERTLGEYTSLLERAGFTGVRAVVTDTPLDAVLAIRPAK